MSKYNLIFVLGGPACGKGTQCSLLAKAFNNIIHVSTGDLVRAKKDLDPEFGKQMGAGGLLPTSFIGNLIVSHIQSNFDTTKTILLDGFPRNQANYDFYIQEMTKSFNLVAVLYIECSDETMCQRAVNRGKSTGRTDDELATCLNRIKIFHAETETIINLFDNKLIKRVTSDDDKNNTFNEIVKVLNLA